MKNRDACSNHSDDSSFNYSDEYDPFDDRGTDLDFDVCQLRPGHAQGALTSHCHSSCKAREKSIVMQLMQLIGQ